LEPELYKECLRLIAERDGLADCSFIPAQMTEIISIEEELGMPLPGEYQEYLLRVGVGEEHGGLAIWYHLDVGRSGNLLEQREKPAAKEKRFLPIYDSLDGEVFGFCQNGVAFQEGIFCLYEEEKDLEDAYSSFSEFLKDNLDCTEEEVEQARADLVMRKIS
jgi:hypothetical protein